MYFSFDPSTKIQMVFRNITISVTSLSGTSFASLLRRTKFYFEPKFVNLLKSILRHPGACRKGKCQTRKSRRWLNITEHVLSRKKGLVEVLQKAKLQRGKYFGKEVMGKSGEKVCCAKIWRTKSWEASNSNTIIISGCFWVFTSSVQWWDKTWNAVKEGILPSEPMKVRHHHRFHEQLDVQPFAGD